MSDIGLQRGIVKLVRYNPKWVEIYETEASALKKILRSHITGIEHVGSTSIPGMIAKPIIDIAVAVKDIGAVHEIIEIMESHKYIYRGEIGIPDRHLFVKGSETIRTHHIHLMPITHYQWETHRLFRDYLINHPESAKEYEKLKLGLQRQYSTNREKYLEGKAEFIQTIIKNAKNTKRE
jgi:GrpB-like predicted nucleotidyltransferase (UPF0157 family)